MNVKSTAEICVKLNLHTTEPSERTQRISCVFLEDLKKCHILKCFKNFKL